MYRIRAKGYSKHDQQQRWVLPDRIFFACGACHILAYAFLEHCRVPDAKSFWIRPNQGFSGNHIFVATDEWAFDYHGYCDRERLLQHSYRRARHWWPGWDATLVELPQDVLISEAGSRSYDGLWLREPTQFLHDAMPRAHAFLERFPPPDRRPKI